MTSDDDRQQQLLARLRRFATDRDRADREEATTIADALRSGLRPVDVQRASQRSREYIRRVARDAGIEPSK